MQRDFCDPLGYMGTRGGDVTATMAIVPRIQQVRDCAAAAGLTIIHTREGHRPDLSDLPENKRLKTARAGAEIGSRGPLGRLLLEPRPGEIVIDKPGTGAFYGTDLHHVLATSGIQNLVLVGVTTGVCVTSTAREASDRGLNVLVISDCCAEPDPLEHEMAIRLLQIEGGYIATIASTVDFVASVNTLAQS
ncbi:isochorismatase family protein [Necator americanus]|uniref:Isochorismatase family protein n=1 Tax=Necator americanus TaxID=51031 RepID=W2TQA7_NECAM|nr:isochorismatase family protein [Necator americanus]ETN83286.1 isochorismatase family protein [Necator americanus]